MTEVILRAFSTVLNVMSWAIVIRAVISYIPKAQGGKFADFIETITEPILVPVRGLISKYNKGNNSGIDFSSIVVLIAIVLITTIIDSIVN